VWMVGATLFTIITGVFVHDDAETIHEALIASATRRPKHVRELSPHLSPAVANVIDRELELEMSDRWESASHMRSALLAAQVAERGGHKPDSEPHPAMPTSRRGTQMRVLTEDTMPDSAPAVQLGSGEVDLEATHYDNQRLAARPPVQPTPRMVGRPQ